LYVLCIVQHYSKIIHPSHKIIEVNKFIINVYALKPYSPLFLPLSNPTLFSFFFLFLFFLPFCYIIITLGIFICNYRYHIIYIIYFYGSLFYISCLYASFAVFLNFSTFLITHLSSYIDTYTTI